MTMFVFSFKYCSSCSFISQQALLTMEIEGTGREVDISSPRKKPRWENRSGGGEEDITSHLPDDIILEIFSFISSFKDRCSCSAVSKKWLIMQANMNSTGFKSTCSTLPSKSSKARRCLEGMKANDTRLAAIAIGISHGTRLAHLCIRGGLHYQGITDFGLQVIANACQNLKSLSLWDCYKAGDTGLGSISESCHSLEKLDLLNCPLIGDPALIKVARNCSNLGGLSIHSCQLVGNKSLLALSKHLSKLQSIALTNCPEIGDDGIVSLVSNLPKLKKVMLVSLRISDCVLQAIGKWGGSIKNLVLDNILNFSELGFCSFQNMPNLESLSLKTFSGLSDASFQGMGTVALKLINTAGCDTLTDEALKELTQSARSLESIKLEGCNKISSNGLMEIFRNCNQRLKLLSLVKCHGLQKGSRSHSRNPIQQCQKLESLSLDRCADIDDSFLSWLGTSCAGLKHIGLVGLPKITDTGILSLFSTLRSLNNCVKSVNFSGCLQLTDLSILGITVAFGKKLDSISLGGCERITDKSLHVIAGNCQNLVDLDLSRCDVTDEGVLSLVQPKHQRLEVLSLAGCLGVTDRSLDFIELMCGNLVGLNLKNCPWLSQEAILSVKRTIWWCDIIC